ncbi:hypothetical protein GGX14DRAFT_451797 [Mycena pura]|uniref:Uncharacterized protein n=1 Tax=Mycena pura TaxID=153505 RepID=A0AAD6YA03_9AGAR|nr:hypothetical protein GGX14DRAFT_451797 [Mycena pura]
MLRTATRLVGRPQKALVARSRPSSSSAAHDGHRTHEQDDTFYPKEGFGAPIWRKTFICTIAAVFFYEYLGAPGDNDRPWVTGTAATESLTDIASTRAANEAALLAERQLVRSATRPPIYRSRNPEDFNNISPYGNAVGMTVHWSEPVKGTAQLVKALEAQKK